MFYDTVARDIHLLVRHLFINSLRLGSVRFVVVASCFLAGSSTVVAAITGTTFVGEMFSPTVATYAPGDDQRLFIAQLDGAIRIFDLSSGTLLATPFLTIPDVDISGEGGLLGLAFHPDYATNGKFYASLTTGAPFTSRIREYTVSGDPNIANTTPTQIIELAKSHDVHNGGWIGFNPAASSGEESYLYVSTGDEGTASNSQSTSNLLGKILRIDVDGDSFPGAADQNYAIPPDNPFVGGAAEDDPIWALGLRNPWRASFDRATGDLWIADVGEERIEEINRQLANSPGGENYGWSRREGTEDFDGGPTLPNEQLPVYDYYHPGEDCVDANFCGYSVIGGYVYRGDDPDLYGQYIFVDFLTNNYWKFDPAAPDSTVERINDQLFGTGSEVTLPIAFGEDAAGNLYILSGGGNIHRIETDAKFDSADFNKDGGVDAADLAQWEDDFGGFGSDADNDGDSDGADFLAWQRQLGGNTEDLIFVPEPTSGLLLAVATTMTLLAGRKRRCL